MTKAPSTALVRAKEQIQLALQDCTIEQIVKLDDVDQALRLSEGMAAMRAALTDDVVERLFMPLMGSPLGFQTDRDNSDKFPPYTIGVVRDCVIEAMIRGFRPVGNEFNIISKRAYFTLNGFRRKVREYPGLTDLELTPGVPRTMDAGALVPYTAKWRLDGAPMQLVCDAIKREDGTVEDTRIPVRVNAGMGPDGILGKARRKVLALVLDRISGSTWETPDADIGDVVDVQGTEVKAGAGASAAQRKAAELKARHARPEDPSGPDGVTVEEQPARTRTREPGEDD